MKTRVLIIIGIIITGVIIASTIGTMEYQSAYNQNCNSDGGYVVGFLKCIYINEDFDILEIPDPICFVTDRSTGSGGNSVTLDRCFPLNDFETLGCTKQMLEHLYKYSNILDEESDGTYYFDAIGLPDDVSKEKFDECVDVILGQRTTVGLENKNVKSEREILECYALFDCNSTNQNFEECIDSYQYGFTVKSMCQFSNVTVNGECVDIPFSDSRLVVCD